MGPNMYYKKYIEKLINSNPTKVTILRQIETDDGYGGSKIEEREVIQTVVIYDRKARREVTTDYGKTYVGVQVTKLLAKGDADIKKGDIVVADETEFKILHVEPYKDLCKQAELEVIK